jgi:predicted GNAT family acetyltransferase
MFHMKPGIRQHGPATLRLGFNTSVPAHMRGGLLEVTHVFTPEQHRGKGYASLLMQKVCSEADEAGKVLLLMPKPYDEGGLDREALIAWYALFGFNAIQTSPVLMARKPGAIGVAKMKPLALAMGMN